MAVDGADVDGGIAICWARISGKLKGSSHIELMLRKPTSIFIMVSISCPRGADGVTHECGQMLKGKS
jgi:hypothetical protein